MSESIHLLDISFEVLLEITNYLDCVDVCRLGSTCKELNEITSSGWIWRQQMRNRFLDSGVEGVDSLKREESDLTLSASVDGTTEIDWKHLFARAHQVHACSNPVWGPRLRSNIDARQCHAAARLGHFLCVFAGFSNDRSLYVLDTHAQAAAPSQTIPWQRCEISAGHLGPQHMLYGHAMVTVDQRTLLVFGGMQAPGYVHETNEVWLLHLEENLTSWRWTRQETTGDPPFPVGYHSACVLHDTMYVFGGISRGQVTGTLAALDLNRWRWRHPEVTVTGAPPPCARMGHSMTAYRGSVVLLGGTSGTGCQHGGVDFSDVHVYDAAQEAWVEHGIPPCPTRGIGRRHGSVLIGDKIVTIGGSAPSTNNVTILDMKMGVWSSPRVGGRKPIPFVSLSAHLCCQNKIFCFGGCTPRGLSQDLFVLDLCSSVDAMEEEVEEDEEEFPSEGDEEDENMLNLLMFRYLLQRGMVQFDPDE